MRALAALLPKMRAVVDCAYGCDPAGTSGVCEDCARLRAKSAVALKSHLVECGVLIFYHHLTKRGLAPKDYFLNLGAGLCLMLALRSALASAGWAWMVLCLMAAGLAHGADLWTRWRRSQV